jgi:hypothetical protein
LYGRYFCSEILGSIRIYVTGFSVFHEIQWKSYVQKTMYFSSITLKGLHACLPEYKIRAGPRGRPAGQLRGTPTYVVH